VHFLATLNNLVERIDQTVKCQIENALSNMIDVDTRISLIVDVIPF